MSQNKNIVPALMFHSVGLERHPWAWSYISESIESFEAKIALLSKRGFHGVFWSELFDHMSGRSSMPENAIFLTFDDGYLDNWVYVFPILKKYGFKGTIFVNPDFVDPVGNVRPNIEDVNEGRCARDHLQIPGFLNWAEMREMEKSGIIDIQSHALTHTWYFSGPKIEGFHRPHEVTPYPWMFWNARPVRKPYYLVEDQQGFVPWGHPIFEHQKSLTVTRFIPEDDATEGIVAFVAKNGGPEFFNESNWSKALEEFIASQFEHGVVPGHYETESERIDRVRYELTRSKSLIEENLDKPVDYICWPGGANDAVVHRIAREAGYKAWTLDSRSLLDKRNQPGEDPESIKRIGTSNAITVKNRRCGSGGAYFQLLKILSHRGSFRHSAVLKAYKGLALIRSIRGMR